MSCYYQKPYCTFKEAISRLISKYENGERTLSNRDGLCLEIEVMMYGRNYPRMIVFYSTRVMMTDNQYHKHSLGVSGSFTKKRYLKLKSMQRWTYEKYSQAMQESGFSRCQFCIEEFG